MIPLMQFPADPGDDDLLERICLHLDGGGLLVHPTETVYGLGAAASGAGLLAVREMKGRDTRKPVLLLLPEPESLEVGQDRWGLSWNSEAVALAGAFWPGALTMVLRDPDGRFPPGIRSEEGGVAVRSSSHPFVRALLKRWDQPMISTSANAAGDPPARSAPEARKLLEGRPGTHRLWIADGGELEASEPSTVVDLTDSDLRVVREGAVDSTSLSKILENRPDGSP